MRDLALLIGVAGSSAASSGRKLGSSSGRKPSSCRGGSRGCSSSFGRKLGCGRKLSSCNGWKHSSSGEWKLEQRGKDARAGERPRSCYTCDCPTPLEVGPVQDRVDIDGNRLGDLVTPVCGSRTVWVDDVRSPPGKIVSGRIFFCFRRPRGHQGSWARRKACHSRS